MERRLSAFHMGYKWRPLWDPTRLDIIFLNGIIFLSLKSLGVVGYISNHT